MKRICMAALAGCILAATGCQKSLSAIDSSNGTDSTLYPGGGNLLAKTVAVSNTRYANGDISTTNYSDSEVTVFSYDAGGKLVAIAGNAYSYDSVTGKAYSGSYFNAFVRDSNGRVTKFYYGGANAAAPGGIDSFYTEYYYVNANSPVIAYEKPQGADSNVYSYNPAGQVARIDDYGYNNGGNRIFTGYQVFSYDGAGNVTQIDVYGYSDGTGTHPGLLAFTYNYQYDANANPFYTGDEIMPQWIWADPRKMHNNPISFIQQSNALGGNLATAHTIVYTYRSDGKPATSQAAIYDQPDVGPHTVTKTTYFYK